MRPGHLLSPMPTVCGDILSAAGFSEIEIEKFDGFMDLGNTPKGASFQVTQLMGPTARALRDADEATRTRAQDAVARALSKFQTGTENIRLGMACWLVRARA